MAESFRSVANKLEFILGDISIMCNVVSEESDLLTFLFALATALTTFRGFFSAYFLNLQQTLGLYSYL